MNKIMFTVYLSVCLLSAVSWADNGLGSLADQLNAISKTAFEKTSKQMAVKVNLSGKQRMLTQKMMKESLLIALDIESQKNKKHLEISVALFEKTLKGLQEGDKSLGLTKTSNKNILKQLKKVTVLWNDFKPNLVSIYRDGTNIGILQNISSQNLPLLAEMNKVVGLYETNSGIDLNELAIVIGLSGKQRMLTQKMTKELLLIAEGIDEAKNKDNLNKTITLFDKTLKGLVEGDAELGLAKTNNKKILTQLAEVQNLWGEFKPVVEKAETTVDSLKKVAELNLPLLNAMDKAVKMYEVQSK
ncbi:MAG: type IV pili methyl-accepting chemotaxis transducer N-terminal domain-containing protein [Cocleimonas sp.]|nr:type IV pili methyl-accepting chemotaxis transducer N-terminal domain-containing protein [Cocleimonas sp.]